jgi:hypothetical protein
LSYVNAKDLNCLMHMGDMKKRSVYTSSESANGKIFSTNSPLGKVIVDLNPELVLFACCLPIKADYREGFELFSFLPVDKSHAPRYDLW